MKATAVIPAYNEATRILPVLEAVSGSPLVGEIIVVDDGSEDGTAEVAAGYGSTRVVQLPTNGGKAAAMYTGARMAKHQVVVFLDADLVNLASHHVDALVAPVLGGEADMTVGQFYSGSPAVSAWMRICPAISGQRAMRTADFLRIPRVSTAGYGVEVVITRWAAAAGLRVRYVPLTDITHVVKERKRGLARGVLDRCTMYCQIIGSLLRNGYCPSVRVGAKESRR